MKIIFNADDFGLSKGVNLGIMQAFDKGVVRSTTVLANGIEFEHALSLSKDTGLKIGLHLVLSGGFSLGKHKTLTDKEGKFFKLLVVEQMAKEGKFDLKEIEDEWELQICKALQNGISLTHFDTHHHVHRLNGINEIFYRLTDKYKVKARERSTTVFSDEFYADNATIQGIKDILQKNSNLQSIEIMCHPSFVDDGLIALSSYNTMRANELEVLTSQQLIDFVEQNKWTLSSYLDV